MPNQLKNSLSPYLLQHKNNPVDWYPWCDEAFEFARKDNRPIFLSIGYAACHWCHVMAHESFEDQEIAKFLNAYYVSIKVDREERPDIDQIYMDALLRIHGHGGWPMSLFLFPDGKPFYGGTYFPNKPKQGMTSFLELIKHIRYLWDTQQEKLSLQGQAIIDSIAQEYAKPSFELQPKPINLNSALAQAITIVDKTEGGLQGAPKFPQVPLWQWYTALAQQTQDGSLLSAVTNTATKLCRGGIYDHLAGGWMRYSTDTQWLVPHFEKMLYDNALIIEWLSSLARYDENNLFYNRIKQTIEWLTNEMILPENVCCASIDADSEGEEGKFYCWTKSEIDKILKDDSKLFCKQYDASNPGNWEGKNILHQNHDRFDQKQEKLFDNAIQLLLSHRARRVHPGKDDKVLTNWNALLITALAKAGLFYSEDHWIDLASGIYEFLQKILYKKNRWYHCYRQNEYAHPGFLDDHAGIIQAAITLFCATDNSEYLKSVTQWSETVRKDFFNTTLNLFNECQLSQKELIINPLITRDSVTPSGNGLMALNYTFLWLITSEKKYEQYAKDLIQTIFNREAPFSISTGYANRALQLLKNGMTIKFDPEKINDKLHTALIQHIASDTILIRKTNLDHLEICYQYQCTSLSYNEKEIIHYFETLNTTSIRYSNQL